MSPSLKRGDDYLILLIGNIGLVRLGVAQDDLNISIECTFSLDVVHSGTSRPLKLLANSTPNQLGPYKLGPRPTQPHPSPLNILFHLANSCTVFKHKILFVFH